MKLEELRARLRMHKERKKRALKPRKRPFAGMTSCVRCSRSLSSLLPNTTCDACAGFYQCDMCSRSLDPQSGDHVFATDDLDSDEVTESAALCKRCFDLLRRDRK